MCPCQCHDSFAKVSACTCPCWRDKREWESGDVAMVQCSDAKWRPAMHQRLTGDFGRWVFGDNSYRNENSSSARPLVVIDPEDWSEVERLTMLNLACYGVREGTKPQATEIRHMQDALREFANPEPFEPPKPIEPLGIGAVIIDDKGNFWTRIADGDVDPVDPVSRSHSSPPWRHRGASAKWWANLKAVEVLSMGLVSEPLADWERDLLAGEDQ